MIQDLVLYHGHLLGQDYNLVLLLVLGYILALLEMELSLVQIEPVMGGWLG